MIPAIGISKPKDKENKNKRSGNTPAANIEKQAGKAERKARRGVTRVRPQAARATGKIERSKPKQEVKQVQREMPQPAPQQNVARQAENKASAVAERGHAKPEQRQPAERAQNQKVAEQAREQKQQAETARANGTARAEAMQERAAKGPKPQATDRGAERAEAAQANAREKAEAMKDAAPETAPQAAENAGRKAERVAEAAEGRGNAARPGTGERGKGNVADAKERLERAKNRANMPDQPTESAENTAESVNDRAKKRKEPAVAATGDPEKPRGKNMERERTEAVGAENQQQAARERQMTRASRQEVADPEAEATLAEADTAEKANVTPEVQAERRQKARQSRTQQTAEVLRDQRHRADRDRRDDFRQRARHLDDDDDALELIAAALGGFAVGAVTSDLLDNRGDRYRYGRLPLSQVGRTRYEREATVGFLTRRFQGRASYDDAPRWFDSPYRDGHGSGHYHPYFYDNNVRVVRYSSYDAVPPVLLGYNRLNRVNVQTWADTPYYAAEQPEYYRQLPEAYRREQAVAVSYPVDPDSAVTEDDILFDQGTTNLADAYSYDLIVDMAEAINSSGLQNERFVVEGHASAEGDYSSNQQLSQDRAERIASDLVDLGVAADRIIPVGYGESEARYPADAPESQRELDRRVMLFRLDQ